MARASVAGVAHIEGPLFRLSVEISVSSSLPFAPVTVESVYPDSRQDAEHPTSECAFELRQPASSPPCEKTHIGAVS